MFPYIPHTSSDEQEMLQTIGLETTDQLFDDIPDDMRLKKALDLPTAKSELEVRNYLKSLADKNCSLDELTCFLGAGAYDHYIPSVVDAVISRSEFYTSYTPYQPEISQGTVQYIFEFQTLICSLTGMDVANASLYDGGTAVMEAALMACSTSRKDEIIVSKGVINISLKILIMFSPILLVLTSSFLFFSQSHGLPSFRGFPHFVQNFAIKSSPYLIINPNSILLEKLSLNKNIISC